MGEVTTDELAFITAICRDPGDDTPRLVFADWLQEQGREERAEFIRVQVALVPMLFRRPCICREENGMCPACKGDGELMRTLAREDELFRASTAWLATEWDHVYLPRRKWTMARIYPTPCVFIDRGFVSEVTCTAADWLAHADRIAWHPEQTVECTECDGRGGQDYFDHGHQEWEWASCPPCLSTGRVARPCPPTAQPITRVTLTTRPHWVARAYDGAPFRLYEDLHGVEVSDADVGRELRKTRGTDEATDILTAILAVRWPGITFTLPES